MELAFLFFSTIGTAVSSVGTAVAGASSLSILQGVATAGSIISTVGSGFSSLVAGNNANAQARLSAQSEALASEERSLRIRKELVQKVGAARVAFAGSGLSLASDQLGAVEGELEAGAGLELGLEKQNSKIRRAQVLAEGKAAKQEGRIKLVSAGAKALGQYSDYKTDLANRG